MPADDANDGTTWDTALPDDWLTQVTRWPWSTWEDGGTPLGWRKTGQCPRCGHTMVVFQRVLKGFAPPALEVRAECNCVGTKHDGRPEGHAAGCGVGHGYAAMIPAVRS